MPVVVPGYIAAEALAAVEVVNTVVVAVAAPAVVELVVVEPCAGRVEHVAAS